MVRMSWIGAALLAAATTTRAADPAARDGGGTPDPAASLRAGHPRLWLLEDRLAELKALAATDPSLARLVAGVLADAVKSKSATPRDHKLTGPRLLLVSRDYLHHIGLLAFAYRWTGERAYADAARAFMVKACAFKDWNPSHFLDTAEMTCAMALGYDWTYDALDAETRRTVEGAILRLGLEPGLRVYESRGWWTKSEYNWNQVCNGGMLAGALALGDVAPEPLRVILPAAIRSLPRALASYAPDGSWGEGPGYWTYAIDYTAFALDALQTALGADFGLGRTPGLSNAGRMPMAFVGPTGLFFNHAHLDLGQFVLDALGVRWIADLGGDDYDLPDYFGRQRWSYYRLNGFSHSIPLIGGRDQDPKGRAEMTGFHSSETGGQVAIDLTGAYRTQADRVMRGVALTRNRRAVLVQDEFRLTAAAEIAWGVTTYAEIRIAEPRKAVLRKDGREMIVRLAAPETAAFSVESGERPKPEKTNSGCRRLMVRVPGVPGETRIAVLFSPVWPDGAADDLRPLLPIDEWRGETK